MGCSGHALVQKSLVIAFVGASGPLAAETAAHGGSPRGHRTSKVYREASKALNSQVQGQAKCTFDTNNFFLLRNVSTGKTATFFLELSGTVTRKGRCEAKRTDRGGLEPGTHHCFG
jgi:hypothetical protein